MAFGFGLSFPRRASAARWTPAALSPVIWADALDTSTIILNGSTVSQWSDKSGNSRHLIQATASKQPAYSATTFNNKPGITFDGIDDILLSNQVTGISGSDPRTFAYAARRPGAGRPIIQIGTTAGLRAFGRDNAAGGLLYHWFADMVCSAGPTNFNYQEVMQSTGAVSTGFRNGTQLAQGNYALNTLNTVLYLGGREGPDFSASILYANIVFAEVIVTRSVLSTEERQLLEGYFAWKWGAL